VREELGLEAGGKGDRYNEEREIEKVRRRRREGRIQEYRNERLEKGETSEGMAVARV